MKATYLDSSAFVKLVVEERESPALRSYLGEPARRNVSSAVLRAEAIRVARRVDAEAVATAREALRQIDLVALDDRVLTAAGDLEPPAVRTLDAIHVATALALGDDLEAIVTYDRRLADAAHALGLRVVSPGA